MVALQKAGVLDLYDFAFQRGRYLGKQTGLAASETIAAGTALVLTSIPLLLSRDIDSMRIVARGTDPEGKVVDASLDVPLLQRKQRNEYDFPVRGAWLVAVGPGFAEPHRWALNEEFALDLVRIGASGKTCRGDCTKLADYAGWGADVVAVAHGEVVSVVTDQKETTERLRKPGESSDAFMERTMAEQMQLLSRGAAGVAGNLVVLRHDGGEYSLYAHLAEGSVAVKAGEKVRRGQRVGKLGHSGNSTEPHLHFGIMDGPDPLYARSLPARFGGLTTADGPQPPVFVQSGWMVEAK
jgi:murein DD-endopeptidase MepM/ murein hydrolase activator NlpD